MTKSLKILLAVWALAACVFGFSGFLTNYPARFAQGIGTVLPLALILTFTFAKNFRAEAMSWNLRSLILFQSWRILPGSLFLYYYYGLGQLPFSFAVIGGYGDILVGITAILICPLGNADRPHLIKILFVWQLLALFDLLFVIRAGFMASLADPNIMRPLTQMPLALLPLMLVPITLFAHFLAIAQLIRKLRT